MAIGYIIRPPDDMFYQATRAVFVKIMIHRYSVTDLCIQRLLTIYEQELVAIDMVVNASKPSCVRIGPRSNTDCTAICMVINIMWVDELRYLGVYILYVHVCSSAHLTRQRNLFIGPPIQYLGKSDG